MLTESTDPDNKVNPISGNFVITVTNLTIPFPIVFDWSEKREKEIISFVNGTLLQHHSINTSKHIFQRDNVPHILYTIIHVKVFIQENVNFPGIDILLSDLLVLDQSQVRCHVWIPDRDIVFWIENTIHTELTLQIFWSLL